VWPVLAFAVMAVARWGASFSPPLFYVYFVFVCQVKWDCIKCASIYIFFAIPCVRCRFISISKFTPSCAPPDSANVFLTCHKKTYDPRNLPIGIARSGQTRAFLFVAVLAQSSTVCRHNHQAECRHNHQAVCRLNHQAVCRHNRSCPRSMLFLSPLMLLCQ